MRNTWMTVAVILVSFAALAGGDSTESQMIDQEVRSVTGIQDLSEACVLKAQKAPKQNPSAYLVVRMKSESVAKDISKGLARLSPSQRDHSRIVIKHQRVFNCMDLPVPDTKTDRINYVMDAAGNVYLFDEFTFEKVRHSSILWKTEGGTVQGDDVASAGEIKIKDQMIVMLNSSSGHYPTSGTVFHQVRKELSDVLVNGAVRDTK